MYKFLKNLLLLILIVSAFSACRKKAFDDFYGRPATLAPAIYPTLQSRGNFTNLLACIDKAGYTSTLSSAGYWTMFAPNDDAFKKYFAANGITSVSQISAATATKIVTYCLAYNAFTTLHIADFQGSAGYQANQAYKRRTAYHASVDTLTVPAASTPVTQAPLSGQVIHVLASNRNGNEGSFVYGDFDNKYIPYFTGAPYAAFTTGGYFGQAGLSAYDYNYFFPNTTYTGFNVIDGTVINADIVCENGVIDEINTVPTPLQSLEQYLAANPNYSHFKAMLDRYMATYVQDANSTALNQVLTGTNVPVYIKEYNSLLAFSPNNENFLQISGVNSGQSNGYTLFVPTNKVFDDFVNSVLLEHYTAVNLLPQQVIADFFNSHMFPNTVWPSKFATNTNNFNEAAIFDPNANIVDKYVCSNGLFYGTNLVQSPGRFSSVYGRAYLDPAYSLMTRALDASGITNSLVLSKKQYTVIMISDAQLIAAGYNYTTVTSQFTYQPPNGGALVTGGTATSGIYRLIKLGIFETPNHELDNLSGNGIYETSDLLGGLAAEAVKYSNNTLFAAGNVDAGNVITVNPTPYKTGNGIVYYSSGPPLQPSALITNTVSTQLAKYGTNPGDPFYMFWQFVKNSTSYTAATGVILGISGGVSYTILVPSNAAIQDAVNNGWLPSTGTGAIKTPNYTSTSAVDQAQVANFIKYHVINGTTIVQDGKRSGSFATLLFNSNGDAVTIAVSNSDPRLMLGGLQFQDNQARIATATSTNGSGAVLGNYVVLQPINTYLQYVDPYNQGRY